jgi:predicted nucleic acid-binding protein
VTNMSQKRALKNYRKRLSERGVARLEVLGLDADRELIRSLAKRLAENGSDATRIRATVRLPFDETAALIWARLMAEGTARGRPRSALDMIIAAVAEANDCVVVTDKERFCGIGDRQSTAERNLNAGNLSPKTASAEDRSKRGRR